jgi:quercetin dioxygenase-like cupin family protein
MYDKKLDAGSVPWAGLEFAGVAIRVLHTDPRSGAMTVVTRMEPGARIPAHSHSRADETVYVIEGDFVEDRKSYGPGSFFAGAAGTVHGPHETVNGCVLLTTFSATLDFVTAE